VGVPGVAVVATLGVAVAVTVPVAATVGLISPTVVPGGGDGGPVAVQPAARMAAIIAIPRKTRRER
jgi:hypothetical protein